MPDFELDGRLESMYKLIATYSGKGMDYDDLRSATGSDAEFDDMEAKLRKSLAVIKTPVLMLNELLERGLIYEPILGVFKVI